MSESKIRIKFGNLEIEYEGSQGFITDQLPELITRFSQLPVSDLTNEEVPKTDSESPIITKNANPIQLATTSIATRLKVKSGTDLALAAAAHLVIVDGRDSFTRGELLAEMKTAKSFYNSNHGKNLTPSLKILLKNKFNQLSTDSYALNAATEEELRSLLAE